MPTLLLPAVSLLSILLMTVHVADDIRRGISPPGPDNLAAVVILAVWSLGTLVFHQRRLGQVVMLLGGIFAAAMPVLHMTGANYGAIATADDGFFFVWTLLAVGTTGSLSILLALRALWPVRAPNGSRGGRPSA